MLTDDEKVKIRAEEIYRDELRAQLNKSQEVNAKSRFWTLINSSIFLWLLSTVAVGGITLAWNAAANNRLKAQKKLEVEEAKRLQINKLNLEIEGRLSQFLVDVESMVERFDEPNHVYQSPYRLKPPRTQADVFKRWTAMKAPPKTQETRVVRVS